MTFGDETTIQMPATRPHMLLLSHCLPYEGGSEEEARAWQLASCAARTHDVYLAALCDRAIHLSQWRAINDLTQGLIVDKQPPLEKHFAAVVHRFNETSAARITSERMNQAIRVWKAGRRFDMVACTHPLLWRATRKLCCLQSVCDFRSSIAHHRKANPRGFGLASRNARRWRTTEHYIARRANIIIVDEPKSAARFNEHPAEAVILSNTKPIDQQVSTGAARLIQLLSDAPTYTSLQPTDQHNMAPENPAMPMSDQGPQSLAA